MKTKPIVPWMGGKRRLLKHLLPLVGHHKCYVEPFAGSAALFFAKDPSHVEVINDINGELVNLYRVVQHHLEEFIRQFKWALVSREMFDWAKLSVPATLTDIQRAARFYYLQKNGFGARVHNQTFGTATTAPPRFSYLRLEEELSAAHLRLHRVIVENEPWQKVVARYDRDHTLFFLDPPYLETSGYGTDFGVEQYEQMSEMFKTLKGCAILTINDHPVIREIFSGLKHREVDITYTVGEHKKARELIYLVNSEFPSESDLRKKRIN